MSEKEEFFALEKFLKNSNHYLVDVGVDLGEKKRKIFDIISRKDFERVKSEVEELKELKDKLSKLKENKNANNTTDVKTLAVMISKLESNISLKIDSKFPDSQQDIQLQANNIETNTTADIYANFDKYYADYIEYKKIFGGVSHHSIKSYDASMKYLKYFVDEKSDFSFKFFKDVQSKLQKLPKNFFKYPKYFEKNYLELMTLLEVEKHDTLNNKTINKHIINFKSFFKYLQYEEYIIENPLKNIMSLSEEKATNKEEYTSNELDKIFDGNMDKSYLNLCRVALYTGLRIEEVLSIKKENIKDNFIHIDLKDSKNKKHERIIPIHKNLVSSIECQKKSNKGDYIFFNGNSSQQEVTNVGKRINRRLKNVTTEEGKSFHSFRKNFSQNIELNSSSDYKTKKYLMGHNLDKDVTHTIYNRGKANRDKLVACINDIDFKY